MEKEIEELERRIEKLERREKRRKRLFLLKTTIIMIVLGVVIYYGYNLYNDFQKVVEPYKNIDEHYKEIKKQINSVEDLLK